MFWWLSFLRPPPVASTSQVEFIIQITNDLRTELYPHPIDIYYTWTDPAFQRFTDPTKLTTWCIENAHKLLSINGPQLSRNRSAPVTCSLGLFTCPAGVKPSPSAMYIDLSDNHNLRRPIPVFSAPISFTIGSSQSGGLTAKTRMSNVKKHDEVQRVYTVPLFNIAVETAQGRSLGSLFDPATEDPKVGHGLIKKIITEKTSPDLDKKVWDSGLGCSSWLTRQALSYVQRQHENTNLGTEDDVNATLDVLFRPGCTVLELGAGCGVVSIFLACILDSLHPVHYGADERPLIATPSAEVEAAITAVNPTITRIYITDLSTAIPLISRNVEANCQPHNSFHLSPKSQSSRQSSLDLTSENRSGYPFVHITAGVLDWGNDELPDEVVSRPCDIIVMSDVTYNTSSFPALLKTLKNLLALSPHAHVILAYKERHSTEREARTLFEREANLQFLKVDEFDAAGGAPTEIWLGKMKR